MDIKGEPSFGLLARRRRKRRKTVKKRKPGGIVGLVVHGSHEDRLRDYVRTHRSHVLAKRSRVSDELNCYRARGSLDDWIEDICRRNLASAALNILMARTNSCESASAGLRFRIETHFFGDDEHEDEDDDARVDSDCFDPCLFGTRVKNHGLKEDGYTRTTD